MAETPEDNLPAPSRLSRISSRVMVCSFSVGLLFFLLAMVSFQYAFLYTLLAAFAVALLSSVVRLSCSIFRESQMRLSELLLCVLLIGLLTSGLMMLLPQGIDEEARPFAAALFLVMSGLLVFVGAARGWSMARKQGETRAKRRLVLLLFGWFQVICLLAAVMAVLLSIAFVFKR